MILEEMNDTLIPCQIEIPQSEPFCYQLRLGAISLDQQIIITGLSNKLDQAMKHPDNSGFRKQLQAQLSAALVPVVAAWELWATKADKAAGVSMPIDAESMVRLPGPLLLAMSGTLGKLMRMRDLEED